MRYIVIAAIIWGSSFPVIKYGLESISPLLFVVLRFSLAFLIFLPFQKTLKDLKYFFEKDLVIISVLHAVAFVAQFEAQTMTSASKTALFVNTSPLFVAVIFPFVSKKLPAPKQIWAMVIALLGVFATSTRLDFGTFSHMNSGDGLNLLSAGCWAMIVILSERNVKKHGEVLFVSGFCFWTVILSAPFLVFEPVRFELTGAGPLIFVAVFNTVVAYFLYSKGIRVVSPLSTAVVFLTEVVVAAAISFLALSEQITLVELGGFLMVMCGVWLAVRK